jgi:chromate transport protein ChrA
MMLTNKVYDILKRVVTIGMPAFIAFYTAIAEAFQWPGTQTVVIVLGAVTTFLGTVPGISTAQYNKIKDAEDTTESSL